MDTTRRLVETVGPLQQQVRAAARTRDLSDLLERRPELAGVYGPADLAAESVRWSA